MALKLLTIKKRRISIEYKTKDESKVWHGWCLNIMRKKLIRKYMKKEIFLKQEIYKLFVSQCKNIEELSWNDSHPLSLFPGVSRCFHTRLHSLVIMADFVNSDALYEMAKFCKSLNILIICEYSKENYGLVSLINAQRNKSLVKISISGKWKYSTKAFERIFESCRKRSNNITATQRVLVCQYIYEGVIIDSNCGITGC
ncbi:hypothetical protein RhiirB3_440687 [Rhizophagus irregularis]|nr:hypothetical protein RhiirB3_440687 [Rhizophagus irregularis]